MWLAPGWSALFVGKWTWGNWGADGSSWRGPPKVLGHCHRALLPSSFQDDAHGSELHVETGTWVPKEGDSCLLRFKINPECQSTPYTELISANSLDELPLGVHTCQVLQGAKDTKVTMTWTSHSGAPLPSEGMSHGRVPPRREYEDGRTSLDLPSHRPQPWPLGRHYF